MTYTVNCSILLTELPLLQRPAAAKEAGFDAVEFWWPFPESVPADKDVDAFVSAIRDAGVQLSGLNFAAGDMPGGDRGLVSWPDRAAEFKDNTAVVAAIGDALGTRGFNALFGNRIDGVPALAQDDVAVENLAVAADAVARIGGTVLIEPVSGADRYPLRTAADAIGVIERVRTETEAENLALLADFYHLAVNGDDVAGLIESGASAFGHIQIADAPGRGAPGTGDLPLTQWLARSAALGYTGPIGLEYVAPIDAAFDWLPVAERGAADD